MILSAHMEAVLTDASPRYAGMILKNLSLWTGTKSSPRYAGMIHRPSESVMGEQASPRYAGMIRVHQSVV